MIKALAAIMIFTMGVIVGAALSALANAAARREDRK